MSNLNLTKWNIYQIDQAIRDIIENDVNEETGEIEYEVGEQLEALEYHRSELTKNVILYYKEASAFQEAIKAEKKRLSDIDSSMTKRLDKLKTFIKNSVQEGEKIKTEQFEIGWRKSSGFEIDEDYLFDKLIDKKTYLENLEKTNPELVKVERDLKKTEVKNLYDKTKTLPEGIKFEPNRQNIQIK